MIQNKIKAPLTLLALLLATAATAQTARKLTGTVIGSKYSVDYDNNSTQSTTVNTKDNVFDNNYNTFFASYDRSNGWVGLDLGEKHIITRVGWSPRKGDTGEKRTVLALFEGANQPDFSDALPLFINTEQSASGKMHYAYTNVSRGFRYVRYIGPSESRCNLAELAFYGYKGEGDDTQFYQLTNLPTVSIHTDNGKDPETKGVDLTSHITLVYDNGTHIQEYPVLTRVRGNASAGFPKKPYRVKFNDEKSHHMMKGGILESPAKAKKWTLINNYGDKTLMRNLVAYEISRRLEMPYTVWSHPVDVIVNGEYHGCYQLTDQITIDPHRVPITEMEPTDVDDPQVRGGYLVEIDAYAGNEPEKSRFYSNRGTPVTIKDPDTDAIQTKQKNYIREFFNDLEARLFSANYTDPETGYRARLNVESFLKHFLLGELSGNIDTYWSVYMYKDRYDDQFTVSPGWDYDLAFENDGRIYPTCSGTSWLYTRGSRASGMDAFVSRILNDPLAYQDLRKIWKQCRDSKAISADALLAYVDSLATEIDQSQTLNFKRWNILNSVVHQNVHALGSFQAEVDFMKDYIANRIQWMDEKLVYTEGVVDDGYGQTFEIASANDLVEFVKKVNAGMVRADAKLTADLNLLAYRSRLTPIGSFHTPYRGTFDGQGHTLSNTGCMIFGTIDGATIKNLGIENGNVVQNLSYAEHTGTLVGSCGSTQPSTITNCYSRVNLASASNDAGGLIGRLYGTMTNCFYNGTIRVSANVGGLVGSSLAADKPANISNSYAACTQIRTSSTTASAGELVGVLHSGSQVYKCYTLGTLPQMVGNKMGTQQLCYTRTKEMFASGNVCWLLNNNNYSQSVAWYQTLGEDTYPVLNPTHGIVIYKNDTYTNLQTDAIQDTSDDPYKLVDVVSISGRIMRQKVPRQKALQGLPKGLYIVDGKTIAQ